MIVKMAQGGCTKARFDEDNIGAERATVTIRLRKGIEIVECAKEWAMKHISFLGHGTLARLPGTCTGNNCSIILDTYLDRPTNSE
jgi:hypothetical protein